MTEKPRPTLSDTPADLLHAPTTLKAAVPCFGPFAGLMHIEPAPEILEKQPAAPERKTARR